MIIAAVVLAAWAYLILAHGGFWRTGPRLPPADVDPTPWPAVTAVVPARDEVELLPHTLPTLIGQDYPGPFSVVVVDDDSRDGTGEAARAVARHTGRHLVVIHGTRPPDGWAGKVWAMAQGLAQAGRPDYVLFTDADIAYAPGTLRALVRAAEADRRDLVSQLAELRAQTGWERLVIPAFVYFFTLLYPFRWVGRPSARTAAAAGGCMLVRRRALEAAGGLGAIRAALIDDVALGRLLKRSGARIWLGHARGVASRRPYPRLADLWLMVARSAYTQLRHDPRILLATVAGLVALFAVPPLVTIVGFARGAAGPAATAGAAWALMTVTYLPTLRRYGLAPWRAAALPLVAMMYAVMTLDSARRHRAGRGGAWKGRTAPARSRR